MIRNQKTCSLLGAALILTCIIISCGNESNKTKMISSNKFTWNVQLAGYDHSMADEKGETNYDDFITEFEKFPWMEQLEEANEKPDNCAPTLSIEDLSNNKSFWVSMAGDKKEHGYILGYIYPKEKKTLFGLGKKKTIRWLEMYATEDKEGVINCLRLFFKRDYQLLKSNTSKMEDFGQMESKDLTK
ncbi:MAG: hypothetical protein COB15_07810 [Flavobacteriales bacterium]|nr:MAG: hypothetical protein COB15_07810 [Flavobacteriales bacterium]